MLKDLFKDLPESLLGTASENRWQDAYIPSAKSSFWQGLEEEDTRRFRSRGRDALKSPRPGLPATLYMDFHRTGNRKRFEDPYFYRRVLLQRMVLAYCAGERDAEMLDGIADALSGICSEMSWVVPAHNWPHQPLPPLRPDSVDLFAANTASLLALSVHLLRDDLDAVAPRLVPRVRALCHERCLAPYMERDGHWWMGFRRVDGFGAPNNWNPWITANFLHTLFLLPDSGTDLKAGVERSVLVLNNYLEGLSPDGGCDEGPSYWVHAAGSLFDCLDILESACGGAVPLKRDPWFRKAASFLERMHIAGDYFFNYADCPGRLPGMPFGLIRRMGRDTENRALEALAGTLESCDRGEREEREEAFSTFRIYRDLQDREDGDGGSAGGAGGARPSRVLYPDLQIALLRGGRHGVTLAFKGGHNAESHNHNDIGSFVLYAEDEPLLVDPGVGEYTRETFNEKRYSIWTMRSTWHNLPEIGGCEQSPGASFACGGFGCSETGGEMDIAGGYPGDAGLESWLRRLSLEDGMDRMVLEDRYRFRGGGSECAWHFVSLIKPRIREGVLSLTGRKWALDILYSPEGGPEPLGWVTAEQAIAENDLKLGAWGVPFLYRSTLRFEALPREGRALFYLKYRKLNNAESE